MRVLSLWSCVAAAALAVVGASAPARAGPDAHYAGSSRTSEVGPAMSFTAANRLEGNGRFGRFAVDGFETWIWDFSQPCPRAGDLPIRLVESGSVVTFGVDGQLTLEASGGWICLDVLTTAFVGRQWGAITGGTGRFEGARGTYATDFEGEDAIPELSRLSGALRLELDR